MIDLVQVYDKLLKDEIDCVQAGEIISSPEIQKAINYIINGHNGNLVIYSDEDMQFVQMVINITQFIYNNSSEETGISDGTYDNLYSIMLFHGGEDIVTVPQRKAVKNIAYHNYPALRGTLKKVYYLFPDAKRTNPSRKFLDEWISSMESKIFTATGRHIDLNNEEIYVFPKFDGLSTIFEMSEDNKFIRALTRGYTTNNEAQDISHVFKNIPARTSQEFRGKKYGIKTEVMVREADLAYYNQKYKTDYKNTRSIVAAILNSDEYDPEKSSLLHVVPLRVGLEDGSQELASEAFSDYPFIRCRMKDRDLINKFALSHKYVNDGLRCDGAVIYIINPEIQRILGRENDINNYEVAYKFTEESAKTILEDVTFTVGLFGRLTPVAKVRPVKLKGNTVENISLGSIGRFRDMHLTRGDIVKVLYDIIPYMTFDKDDGCKSAHGKPFEVPKFCPECGAALEYENSDDILSCTNPYCDCRIKGRIINFINKMNIENISFATIDTLYEFDIVRSIQDLYRIEENKKAIVKLSGFGAKKVNSWIKSINENRTVADYIVLGALGIEGIGRRMFNKICSIYTIKDLIEIVDSDSLEKFLKIPGIKDKTAKKIMDGLKNNLDLIEFLEDELTIYNTKNAQKSKFKVCFTKIRDDDAEKTIRSYGGEVVDSLTKDTNILVVPTMDTESSKVTKARKYGAYIVPIDDLPGFIYSHY